MFNLSGLVAKTCIVVMLATCVVPWARAADDTTAPVILHTQPDVVPAEAEYELKAKVTDDTGVKQVQLNFRAAGDDGDFRIEQMVPALESIYSYKFGAGVLRQPGYEYFISAEDQAGNTEQSGFAFDPLNLRVGPALAAETPKPQDALATSTQPSVAEQPVSETRKSNLAWYVLGAVAVLALAAGGGGGGGGGSAEQVTINLPQLQ